MFDKFFKKAFKSRKTISEEEAKELKEQIKRLEEDNILREGQIIRLKRLANEDPSNCDRYKKRITVHTRIVEDNKITIQKLEIKLLDS
tara:strand:- start:270 stop:533 length:264 start_codon:yes stop_codon:yes gene_type:complete